MENTTVKTPAVSADVFGSKLTIAFSDGRMIELDAATIDAGIRQAAMMHGFKQKLLDAAAIARNTTTGRSASLADKYDAVEEVFNRITATDNPTWNKGRTEGAGSGGGLLKRALMAMTGKTAKAVDEFLGGKTKEEKAAMRKNPKVAEIILELQSAGVDNSIDTEGLLGELMGDSDDSDGDDGDEA